jgi:WD40 repeat protein
MLILWTHDGQQWIEQKRKVLTEKIGISCVRYSPSGLKLFVGRQDGACEVWDAIELSREAAMDGAIRHHQPINCGVFSADEQLIVTGSDDKDARGILWKFDNGEWIPVTEITGHSEGITSVAFSPIHQLRLLTGSRDGTAKLWDISHWTAKRTEHALKNAAQQKTTKELLTLHGHDKAITAVDFDRTGQFILTASRDGKTIRWSSAQINPAVVARRDFVDLLPGQPVHFCRGFEILDPVSPTLEGGILSLSIRPISGAAEFWDELPPMSVGLDGDRFLLEKSADKKLSEVILKLEGSENSRKKIGTVVQDSATETELSLPLEIHIEQGISHLELMDFLDQLVCTPQVPEEQTGQFELVVRLKLELPPQQQGPTQEAVITLRIDLPENEVNETE